MRKNFGAKPIIYPQPVFIIATYNDDGTPNAMNAAWGGISEHDQISMCISEDHQTTKNALARGAFTVSMATVDTVVACDYVGIVSGSKVPDKMAKAGFHTTKSEFVDAPPHRRAAHGRRVSPAELRSRILPHGGRGGQCLR